MQYKQIAIQVADTSFAEILMAQLSDIGFEGFEEREDALLAFIPADKLDEAELKDIVAGQGLSYKITEIEEQNWNAQWEESFQPVVVPGFCTIRAHFHNMPVTTPHEIIITPQMSFGTGHHATTMLMMMQMQQVDMRDSKVLDFGTGTGILAILAEQLRAKEIVAIDNDSWSFENAIDNVERNNCDKIKVLLGSLEEVKGTRFDLILANINRHILLENMKLLCDSLVEGGKILMSGLLKEDIHVIKPAAEDAGFGLLHTDELNGWIVLLLNK